MLCGKADAHYLLFYGVGGHDDDRRQRHTDRLLGDRADLGPLRERSRASLAGRGTLADSARLAEDFTKADGRPNVVVFPCTTLMPLQSGNVSCIAGEVGQDPRGQCAPSTTTGDLHFDDGKYTAVCDGKENRVFALLKNKLYAWPSAPPRRSCSGRNQMQKF